jgi:hypothetical protein
MERSKRGPAAGEMLQGHAGHADSAHAGDGAGVPGSEWGSDRIVREAEVGQSFRRSCGTKSPSHPLPVKSAFWELHIQRCDAIS